MPPHLHARMLYHTCIRPSVAVHLEDGPHINYLVNYSLLRLKIEQNCHGFFRSRQ
jgi:hypothetical protein